jgi:hypothetical protein
VAGEIPVPIAFASTAPEPPHLEIRINFGVFAGREATPAELDDLGRTALTEVAHVTLVGQTETSLHQVRMDVPRDVLAEDQVEADSMRDRLIRVAERWARSCIDTRHAEVIELFPTGDSSRTF